MVFDSSEKDLPKKKKKKRKNLPHVNSFLFLKKELGSQES